MKTILTLFLVMISAITHAQVSSDARNVAMGRTSVANSYGICALDNNPANIGINGQFDKSQLHFSLFSSFGYVINSGFISYEFYNNYFTGDGNGNKKILTHSEKVDIFNSSKDTKNSGSVSNNIVSLVYKTPEDGTFGLSISDEMYGRSYIPVDFAEFALFGNEINRLYDFSEFNLSFSKIRQITLSYSNQISGISEGLTFGVSVKPTLGYQYFETYGNNITIFTNDSNEVSGSGIATFRTAGLDYGFEPVSGFSNIAGFGIGFDLGLNLKLNDRINAGFSITDIGWVRWNKNTMQSRYDANIELTDLSDDNQLDSLLDLIKEKEKPVNSFTSILPTNFRIGLMYRFIEPHNTLDKGVVNYDRGYISLEYLQGFSDKYAGSSLDPRVSIGAEWIPDRMFSIRSGIIAGGEDKFALSFGAGGNFGPVSVNIGTHNIIDVFDIKSSSRNSLMITVIVGLLEP